VRGHDEPVPLEFLGACRPGAAVWVVDLHELVEAGFGVGCRAWEVEDLVRCWVRVAFWWLGPGNIR